MVSWWLASLSCVLGDNAWLGECIRKKGATQWIRLIFVLLCFNKRVETFFSKIHIWYSWKERNSGVHVGRLVAATAASRSCSHDIPSDFSFQGIIQLSSGYDLEYSWHTTDTKMSWLLQLQRCPTLEGSQAGHLGCPHGLILWYPNKDYHSRY